MIPAPNSVNGVIDSLRISQPEQSRRPGSRTRRWRPSRSARSAAARRTRVGEQRAERDQVGERRASSAPRTRRGGRRRPRRRRGRRARSRCRRAASASRSRRAGRAGARCAGRRTSRGPHHRGADARRAGRAVASRRPPGCSSSATPGEADEHGAERSRSDDALAGRARAAGSPTAGSRPISSAARLEGTVCSATEIDGVGARQHQPDEARPTAARARVGLQRARRRARTARIGSRIRPTAIEARAGAEQRRASSRP